ncbi:MAG: hypothetical protein ACYTHM_04130 [Planctomycetota bacterium]
MGNPFLRFEGIWFARSWAARFFSGFFPLIVSAASLVVFFTWTPPNRLVSLQRPVEEWRFMAGLLVSQAVIVGFLAPLEGLSRGLRETRQGNFDLLVTSPVTTRTLFVGLMGGSAVPLIFLVATTLPVALLVLIVGNMQLERILAGYLILVFLCIAFSSFGVYMSVRVRSPGIAWQACITLSLILFLGGPLVDFLVFKASSVPMTGFRALGIWAVTLVPGLWGLVCAYRGRGWVRLAAAMGAVLLLAIGAVAGSASFSVTQEGVFAALSPPAVLLGEGFKVVTGMKMDRDILYVCMLYLGGLSLLFVSAAYLRLEKRLDRRPFHEL